MYINKFEKLYIFVLTLTNGTNVEERINIEYIEISDTMHYVTWIHKYIVKEFFYGKSRNITENENRYRSVE